MRKIFLPLLLLSFSSSKSQIQYNDAIKLRGAIRWIYVWNISSDEGGTPPTMSLESVSPYTEPFTKSDTIIGGKHIHFLSHEIPKIGFTRDVALSEIVKSILRFYSQHPDETDFTIIKNDYKDNPFINPYIANGNVAGGNFASTLFSSIRSAAGNLNVTNFADGLAKFLIERSKEELNVAFFRKLQDFLKSYPEVKVLFPSTVSIINNIAAYNYAAMLPALRASFQKDLNAISANFLALRETTSYEGYNSDGTIKARADAIATFLNTTLAGRSICGSVIAANEMIKGTNAADVITKIANDRICVPRDNFSNAIQFVDLISQSLRSTEEARVWITKQQANGLVKDEILLRLYFGLLYATDQKNASHITFAFSASTITLQSFLTNLSAEWSAVDGRKFIETFNNVASSATEIADNAKNIVDAKKQTDQPLILQYADYASSVSNFLRLTLQLLPQNDGINPGLSNLTSDIEKFITVIDAATNACYDIKSQNYSALILHTSLLLTEIPGVTSDLKNDYIKYGTFMANIVEAKNSDEVKAAIDAAVLPVGSSSIKRETDVNISLNAFIGPYAGYEYLPTLKQNQWALTYGVTAPVGVAFSWGNFGNGKKNNEPNTNNRGGKSLTLFVPLIDIGALAAFRAGDDSSKVASEVQLENIIAPGLFFYYGFGKCPISIGFGGQIGPQLREVTATDVNIDKNFYVRFGINLVVDIPFFNFYTKN